MSSVEPPVSRTGSNAKIPNDEFYRGFGPPTPSQTHPQSWEAEASTRESFREVETPGQIEGDRFFRRAPPREAQPSWLRSPFKFGGALTGFGAAGIILGSVTIIHDIVLVAPIFEEFFKFGVALLLVALLRAEHPMLRLLIALLPGVSFGVMEHYLTYSAEAGATYAFRVLFHSGSTALSMTVFSIVEPVVDARARLFSTLLSTVLHWINNAAALITGILSFAGVELQLVQFMLGLILGLGAHVLAWGLLLLQRNVRLFTQNQVAKLDPFISPQTPPPPPEKRPAFVVGEAGAAGVSPGPPAGSSPPAPNLARPALGERASRPTVATTATVRKLARPMSPPTAAPLPRPTSSAPAALDAANPRPRLAGPAGSAAARPAASPPPPAKPPAKPRRTARKAESPEER